MTIELVKILEAAEKAHERSIHYFELSENDPCEEMHQIYWTRCQELAGEANGLLKAYEILTGKKVHEYAIDKELALA